MTVGKIIDEEKIDDNIVIVRYPTFTDLNKNCSFEELLDILKPHQFNPNDKNILNNKKEKNKEIDILSKIIKNNELKKHLFLILEYKNEIIGGGRIMYRFPNHKIRKHIGYFNVTIKNKLNNNTLYHKLLSENIFKEGKKELNFKTILTGVSSGNKKNKKLYSEIGFKEVGRIKKGIKKDDNYYDYIIMQIEDF